MSQEPPTVPGQAPVAPPPPPAMPAKKAGGQQGWLIVIGALVVIGIIAVAIAMSQSAKEGGPTLLGSVGKQSTSTVVYKLTGSAAKVDLTMQAPTGSNQQGDVTLPLTRASDQAEGITFTFPAGAFLYLSAQISDENGGDVTCQIVVDGTVVSTNTASGFASIVTCEGTA